VAGTKASSTSKKRPRKGKVQADKRTIVALLLTGLPGGKRRALILRPGETIPEGRKEKEVS